MSKLLLYSSYTIVDVATRASLRYRSFVRAYDVILSLSLSLSISLSSLSVFSSCLGVGIWRRRCRHTCIMNNLWRRWWNWRNNSIHAWSAMLCVVPRPVVGVLFTSWSSTRARHGGRRWSIILTCIVRWWIVSLRRSLIYGFWRECRCVSLTFGSFYSRLWRIIISRIRVLTWNVLR